MVALGLALFMAVAGTGAAAVTHVPVVVVAREDVSDALVKQACFEAQAIWERAGVVLDWHRAVSSADAPPWSLEVTIDDREAPVHGDGALGWLTFSNDVPDRAIHLSRRAAEQLLHGTPGAIDATIAAHDELIGRALGRALAHELGHYLLRSKAHTRRGLMRAARGSEEFFRRDARAFELTPQQRAAAAGSLWMD